MKNIILHISILCMASTANAQTCPQIEGLTPIQLQFGYNGTPQTVLPMIPLYWNRFYKLDESTGQLSSLTCAYTGDPNIHGFAYCVCFLTGTYFRRVTDVCDPTPCGGDLPYPGMPITNNNTSGSGWSQNATWVANEVPDITSSPAVILTKSTQIDMDLSFPSDHWLVLSAGNSSILSGKTVTSNSVIQVYPAAGLQNFGVLKGTGQILGSLVNSGTLSPGNSPGKFTIVGNYTADNTAVHEIEIAAKNLYDTINIATDVSFASGNAVLNGTLHVSLLNGFLPSLGDTFRIFSFTSSTGLFANASLPTLPAGLLWSIHYNATDVSLTVDAGTLPLKFTTINAYYKSGGVQVNWTTQNEINVKNFEVERSADGARFRKISTVKAIGGNSTGYEWFDATPSKGNNYYRVKAIDADGRFDYSLVRLIKIDDNEMVTLYPNPVKKGEVLRIGLQNITANKIEILNISGQLVYTNSLKLTGSITIPISPSLPPGQYIIRVVSENKVVIRKMQLQ